MIAVREKERKKAKKKDCCRSKEDCKKRKEILKKVLGEGKIERSWSN